MTDASDTIASAAVIDSVAMPLRARYTFALAPVVREIEKRISNFDSKNEIEKRN